MFGGQMTEPPNTLRIGAATYAVIVDREACELADAEGLSNGPTQKILLRGGRPQDTTAKTLLHEVLHQCIYQAEADLERIGEDLVGQEAEEFLVNAASGLLLCALRDNPALVKWLTA